MTLTLKRQPQKMVKHTQTLLPTNCLSVFDNFVGLTFRVLSKTASGKCSSKEIIKKETFPLVFVKCGSCLALSNVCIARNRICSYRK